MAADRVAAGVLPLGLDQSLRSAIAWINSGALIGSGTPAGTRAAASRAFSFSGVSVTGLALRLLLAFGALVVFVCFLVAIAAAPYGTGLAAVIRRRGPPAATPMQAFRLHPLIGTGNTRPSHSVR